MAGLHLRQLHTACLALASDLNTALQTAGVDPLTGVYGEPPTNAVAPCLVVTFAGWRGREPAGLGGGTQETVHVAFRLETDGGEAW